MQNHSRSLCLFTGKMIATCSQKRHDHEAKKNSQQKAADKNSHAHSGVSLSFRLYGAMGAGGTENQTGPIAALNLGDEFHSYHQST